MRKKKYIYGRRSGSGDFIGGLVDEFRLPNLNPADEVHDIWSREFL